METEAMKSAGHTLKEARELQGLSLAEVSLSTKITVRMLRALEAGDRETLPAPSFTRGFIRSYASLLKLDADELVRIFNDEIGVRPPGAAPTMDLGTVPTSAEAGGSDSTGIEKLPAPHLEPRVGLRPEVDPNVTQTAKPSASQEAVAKPAAAATAAQEAAQILNPRPSKVRYVAMGLGVFALVGMIIFVSRMVTKYEREGVVEAPTDLEAIPQEPNSEESEAQLAPIPAPAPDSTDQAPNDDSAPVATAKASNQTKPESQAEAKTEPKAEPTPAKETTPKEPPPQVAVSPAVTTATAGVQATVPSVPAPATTTATAAATTTTTTPTGATANPTPGPTGISSSAPTTTTNTASEAKSEFLIEALDKVEIRVSSKGGAERVFQLNPGEVRSLRVGGGTSLTFSDGGAVNLIQNGQDLGVAGDLGRPKKVSIP